MAILLGCVGLGTPLALFGPQVLRPVKGPGL